jgi:hypothetical protein
LPVARGTPRPDLGALIEDALDCIALLSASRLADLFEDLLQPLDLALGLVVVLLERGTELIRVGGLRHLWQGFVDLLLGVIDVF